MEILAVVPARGGSKAIPRKNIRLLDGRPLIAYTLDAIRESSLITRALVSTDDNEVATVAERCGAAVPFIRPNSIALDDTTDLPVFEHCLEWLWTHESYRPNLVVHLRPTAPLRRAQHIDQAINILLDASDADAVRSVTRAREHPLKTWRLQGDYLRPFLPTHFHGIKEPYNQPRQKLPPAFIQNGSIDVIRTVVILEQHSMSGDRIKPFVMNEFDSLNIDDELDWQLAEILIRRRREKSSVHKMDL